MHKIQEVKETLEAIESVKARAKAAMDAGDSVLFNELMGDLYALEACLVGAAKALVEEIDLNKRAA